MPPAVIISWAFWILGENTELSAYPCHTPASRTMSRICWASAPVRASGLVQMMPLPADAAILAASTCASFGSAITTRSMVGSAQSSSMLP